MHHYSIHLYIFHMYIYTKKLIDNELAIFGSSLCSIMRNKLPSNLHQFQIFSSRKCFLKCKLHIVSHFECVPWDAGGSSDDGCSRAYCFDSLAPGKFDWNFRHVIFKQILVIVGWGISCEIALIWMSLDFTDNQSTLVQVMAWCHQATSHYLSQCWLRSASLYGVTRLQWVNYRII